MRRTLHTLSVTVLAGSALVGIAPVVAAEPAAEVSPATVEPGGTLTISVSCDPDGGPPPDTIEATSQAFDEGTVPLRKVTGNDDKVSGPAYRGTARIAPAENFEDDPDAHGEDSAWTVDGTCPAAPGGEGKEWSATFTVAHGGGGAHSPSHKPSHDPTHQPCHTDEPAAEPDYAVGDVPDYESGDESGDASGDVSDYEPGDVPDDESGDVPDDESGDEPAAEPDHESGDVSDYESGDVPDDESGDEPAVEPEHESGGTSWQDRTECGDAAVRRGVRAGGGGAFTDSVPALVAGGVLIAGAFAAAVHRLRTGAGDPYR
ncbi:hypothetical protein KEF29_04115 [Streptomyces tuirus]|uniref:Secreted protein n=1 Tax=Streptomyces tuirus TaxID=68278 RepID=A0A941F813_9ACTN|nr:hypothetical protein [Streptomyces tuirus]